MFGCTGRSWIKKPQIPYEGVGPLFRTQWGTTGAKHRRVGQKYHYICVLERFLNGLTQTTLAAGRPIRGVFPQPRKVLIRI